ncbi:L,D-transpeptidase [Candidatus Daviesbacteria bacterium]|nr:L,D-transpeptidase [Candidatus Daviesbacteria bacterium]
MLHRLLPLILIIIAFSYLTFNFQTLKRDLSYKFGASGDSTTSCCSEQEVLSASGNFDENANLAIFNNETINYPKTSLAHNFTQSIDAQDNNQEVVLGTTAASGEEKWIEVSLPEQKLRAWEGSRIVMEYPISSGKWAPTPKGTFYIWYKTRSQKMSGGSKELGTYYYLPNVPHNMFFYKGYAIHGAYWHNNFGNPMSHGCVNQPLNYAAQIFDWAGPVVPAGQNVVRASPENPGTRVYVH